MEKTTEDFKILISINLQNDIFTPGLQQFSLAAEGVSRLFGNDLKCGPLGMFLNYINHMVPEDSNLVEIVHLKTISNNNLDTDLIRGLEEVVKKKSNHHIIDIGGVNPFMKSELGKFIEEKIKEHGKERIRVGLVGVNCESTMSFLVYELFTRFELKSFFTCSHLITSKRRIQLDSAILQLREIFNVHIFSSVTDFQLFVYFCEDTKLFMKSLLKQNVGGHGSEIPQTPVVCKMPENLTEAVAPMKQEIKIDGVEFKKIEVDIIQTIYRDCSEFHISPLSGGYGWSKVFRVKSTDWYGQEMASTVLKIGRRDKVSTEKNNFERVSGVLGTSAPQIVDYVEMGDRAAIRFMYASMSPDEKVNTFQKVYRNGESQEIVNKIIETTFDHVLGRFYKVPELEMMDLFEKYQFNGKGWNRRNWCDDVGNIRTSIKELMKCDPNLAVLKFGEDLEFRNIADFMEKDLPWIKKKFMKVKPYSYQSFVHGDMNTRNILLDGNNNVWLIDFEYTEKNHIIKDIVKMEVDIMFELTKIENEDELKEALIITKELLSVKQLGSPLREDLEGLTLPKLKRAWTTVRRIRESTGRIARNDKSTLQLNILLLRYGLFVTSFARAGTYNRIWALATACGAAELILEKMKKNMQVYINWIPQEYLHFGEAEEEEEGEEGGESGKLGISINPGNRGSTKEKDLQKFKDEGVEVLFQFLSAKEELANQEMKELAKKFGMEFYVYRVRDQNVPSLEGGKKIVDQVAKLLLEGKKKILLISRSGLGRCGTIASCVLLNLYFQKMVKKKKMKLDHIQVMRIIRSVRKERAIENKIQEKFVERYYRSLVLKK